MNLDTIRYLNIFLGVGAILLQIFAVVALFVLLFTLLKKGPKENKYLNFLKKYFLIIGFAISFLATFFSLMYSEVIGFTPCRLCWFQRIFMYPQVLIFGVALWHRYRNKLNEVKNVIKYTTPLLLIGFAFSIYHNILYYSKNSINLACDSSGVSCFKRIVSEFGGYISIPTFSLTAFFVLLILILAVHFYRKE